jgi:hypothetical protein
MVLSYDVYFAIVLTGIFVSVGGAITEIWIKPWLKRLKKKHDALIIKVNNSRKKLLKSGFGK